MNALCYGTPYELIILESDVFSKFIQIKDLAKDLLRASYVGIPVLKRPMTFQEKN